MRRRTTGKGWVIFFALMTVLMISFIFSNSLKTGPESNAQSGFVIEILKPVIDPGDRIADGDFNFYVRKAAHLIEYCGLGLCLGGLLASLGRMRGRIDLGAGLFGALFTAVIDEFIQSFTGRTSSVSDVLLDFTGASAGFLMTGLVCVIWLLRKRKRETGLL